MHEFQIFFRTFASTEQQPMRRFFTTTLLVALTIISALAQNNYRLRQLTMDQGLPSNAVRSIVQDKHGFVWIATANGLCRYDGNTVKLYDQVENNISAAITTLLPLDNGDLLVGTDKESYVLSFENEQPQLLPIENKTSIAGLANDKDGLLWIATEESQLLSYNQDEDELTQLTKDMAGGSISTVYADANNQLWVLTQNDTVGIWRLNKSDNTLIPFPLRGKLPSKASAMLQTSYGHRWIGTWEHGLVLLADDGTLTTKPISAPGHCQHIHTMLELSATSLLLGCDDGLWLFDTTHCTYSLYLPVRFVSSIWRDQEGGIWIGTAFSGVTYCSPIAQRFKSHPVGQTAHFCVDKYQRMWVTRENGGLDCYPSNSNETVNYAGKAQLDQLQIHSLAADDDWLWIGTHNDGIYQLNTTRGQLRHYLPTNDNSQLFDPNACTLMRDHKGHIWVATMEGLCRYNREKDRFERMVTISSEPFDMDEDQQGRIWVSTQGGGVWRYDPQRKQTKTFSHDANNEHSLSNNIVNCIFVDGKGVVWAATQGGLCQFDDTNDCFERLQLDVPRQAITSIIEDQGVLWLSSQSGILRYEAGKGLQRFTRQDGLDSEQFQPNAVVKTADGRICFGTMGGFNSFYPYQIKVNQLSAPVFITSLEINNQPIEVGQWHLPKALSEMERLDLWSNDKVFSLSFASLSYCSPEKNMYAYMLEGFDRDWNYVGHEQKATYTNLAPGIYTFRVKATNNDGIWSTDEARLVIEVHPPFWWNIYAKIAYVILFIVLIYLFIRFRLYLNERRHRKEIEQLNLAKQEEAREARMKFFTMISHEIRTPVSLIIAPLEQLKKECKASPQLEIIDNNAHRLLELVNQLLDFRKVELNQQTMNFAPYNMKELMKKVVANFEPSITAQNIKLKVNYPDSLFTAVVDRESIVKVLSNLLSNAIKYAHSSIELSCKVQPQQKTFTLEVNNDGPIIDRNDQAHLFDLFYQAHGNKPGTGIGLSIVKSMVEQHHGHVEVTSELGRGTTFTVTLPIAQEFSSDSPQTEQERKEEPLLEKSQNVDNQQNVKSSEAKPKLLIVDDNEEMLTFLVTTFMDQYEVLSAKDGTEALKLVEESLTTTSDNTATSSIDIIISDWMMNNMDGNELCSRLRQNAATVHIPFILLTAKTDSQSKVQAMQAGVDAYIEKPFAVKYLEACIANLLKRKRNV